MKQKALLCVDDEQTVLNTLRSVFYKQFGHDYIVEVAQNAYEALEIVDEFIEDGIELQVIISDYMMPQMKGDELLIKVHEKNQSACKIMLTGQSNIEGIQNAINNAHLYRFLEKPWINDDLILTVQKAIHAFEQAQQLVEKNAELERINTNLESLVHQRTQELAAKNKLLHDSINYAAILQRRSVSSKVHLDAFFQESFVNWLPRDSVGGDIWFFHTSSDNRFGVLFIIDCTGHGVSGALISMGVSSIKREILSHMSIDTSFSPKDALHYFDEKLKSQFLSDEKIKGASIGFEGAVIWFDKQQELLRFSSASIDAFVIDQNHSDHLRSDKCGIGYSTSKKKVKQETQHSFKKGMRLLVSTDGLYEQLDKPEGMHFGKKRMLSYFNKTPDKPLEACGNALINDYHAWYGNGKRFDDVTVIAVEL